MNHLGNHRRRRTAEWKPATKQLVQHHAQAVLVAGRADLVVLASPARAPCRRACPAPCRRASVGRPIPEPGQTEIGQEWIALGVQHDIARLHVAMDDPQPVGVLQREARSITISLARRKSGRSLIQASASVWPFDERRGDEDVIAVRPAS